jgi:hypothetical protein
LRKKALENSEDMEETPSNLDMQKKFAFVEQLKKQGTCIITLGDLFEAIENDTIISNEVDRIFKKKGPLNILIEGSAFEQNMDVLHQKLAARNNAEDGILLIDIREIAAQQHIEHIKQFFPEKNYRVMKADANDIPLLDGSADLIINDCTINFNASDELNKVTLSEIKRVLKSGDSLCLLSVVVDRRYDDPVYGQDQELVSLEKVDVQGIFYPLMPNLNITLGCWPLPHYKSLFKKAGFVFTEFDILKGKSYCPAATKISYRRFILKLSS